MHFIFAAFLPDVKNNITYIFIFHSIFFLILLLLLHYNKFYVSKCETNITNFIKYFNKTVVYIMFKGSTVTASEESKSFGMNLFRGKISTEEILPFPEGTWTAESVLFHFIIALANCKKDCFGGVSHLINLRCGRNSQSLSLLMLLLL